ncbi:hypothetical protein [Acidithiobacillus ferriphilus]|uniref:hypothetical protein n=1 Tax=Acidithiobacillus ferriphilus TaxID=1689834 RepID=UPI001C0696C6|nr:hypothetical protein [Acidithiobacillus ferriphilus]MBU2829512.1 hypothetical protein [Acidithiobacillus ferriphilus]
MTNKSTADKVIKAIDDAIINYVNDPSCITKVADCIRKRFGDIEDLNGIIINRIKNLQSDMLGGHDDEIYIDSL